MYSEEQFQELTDWMVERFREQGVTITKVYHCPHHPDFGPADERDCDCRKPKPGMILRGIEEFELDPAACIMIGDKGSDMDAAEAANLSGKIMVCERSQSMTKKSKTSFIKTLAELTS
jgi:D-glycero-D-manno-heptose 1,7-bisphosphate phosphatase